MLKTMTDRVRDIASQKPIVSRVLENTALYLLETRARSHLSRLGDFEKAYLQEREHPSLWINQSFINSVDSSEMTDIQYLPTHTAPS